ncbi:MAG: hypothetical protein HQK70_07670 [Desulfamplus sp.]|nr:hypothetical protein [Desulfamplus sp.]
MKLLKTLILASILMTGLNLICFNPDGIIWLLECSRVSAQELTGLKISGYGTLSATTHDRSDIHPVRDVSQAPENRFKTNFSAVMDSRLGLQAHYRFSSNLDAVVQGVLRDQSYITFNNSLELAYIAYRPSSWLELRAGRFGYDAFLMSDTRNLGYAYSWVRPPNEFYGWVPVFHTDGADATLRIDGDDSQWRLRVQAGEQAFKFALADSEYDAETESLQTLSLSRQSGPLTLKAGYSAFSLKNEMNIFIPLHEGLNQIADATASFFPEISSEARYLRDNTAFKGTDITYLTLGASYDDGQWIAQAELAHSTSNTEILSHGTMGYAALGYRIGDFTPYFIFSATRAGNDIRKSIADWSIIEAAELQETVINIINTTRMDQETLSFGVRWDFHNQAALKLQLDSIHINSFGYGLWFAKPITIDNDSSMSLGTISLEVMF